MPEFLRKDFQLHVGWRTIKTAVSAMLVAIVYCLIGRNPAFACIGVIFGMGVDMRDSIQNGGNRLFGTLIGGLLSIGVFWVYLLFYPQGGHTVFLAVLLGGISNQWDRLRRGSVTDYLQFPHRKAKKRALVWNLADFMLIGGVVLTVAGLVKELIKK